MDGEVGEARTAEILEIPVAGGAGVGDVVDQFEQLGDVLSPVIVWPLVIAPAAASITAAVVLYRNGRRRVAEPAQSFSTGA
ncbi:hypothetical protein E1262_04705 [Jiangella aurantiaca]|uniref:Uncharacterized protein n=1 Tax=Jiangella aurantiaca TaxID=2530373 RepID=A0A4V2YT09_9ACTN|nr:hypothetical protein [Jiangella aurantiaca]TDD72017.1 hypothetical protein E1262_04705 [Jiangella aurantiaca]